jgi:hypothetical protein
MKTKEIVGLVVTGSIFVCAVAEGVAILGLKTSNDSLKAAGTALSGMATDSGQELAKCGDANKILIVTQKALVERTQPAVAAQIITQEVTRQVPVTVVVKETGEICVVEPTKTNTPTPTKRPFITFTPSSTRTRVIDTSTPLPPTDTPRPQNTQPPRDTDVPPTNPPPPDTPKPPTPPVATAAPTNEHIIATLPPATRRP